MGICKDLKARKSVDFNFSCPCLNMKFCMESQFNTMRYENNIAFSCVIGSTIPWHVEVSGETKVCCRWLDDNNAWFLWLTTKSILLPIMCWIIDPRGFLMLWNSIITCIFYDFYVCRVVTLGGAQIHLASLLHWRNWSSRRNQLKWRNLDIKL